MSEISLASVATRSAAEVCGNYRPTRAARELLRPDLTPAAYLTILRDRGKDTDALEFLVYALPKPEAIWWLCLCLELVSGSKLAPTEAKAVETAVRWVLNPLEENRRAAEEPAQAAGFESPAGCLAHAVFWSGGSMAPAKLPPMPPAPNLTPKAVTAGLLLLATQLPPLEIEGAYSRFLELGISLANGKYLWAAAPSHVS